MDGFKRYLLSPLATLLTLLAIHLASRFEWFTVSLALPVGVLALCLFWSGLRANILSAIFISAYALYSSSFDPSRAAQLIFTACSVAIFGGVMRRWLTESVRETERQRLRAEENQLKADFVDSLNGNIEETKLINTEVIELIDGLQFLSKGEILERLNRIQGKTVNLAQRVIGWHQLALEREALLKDE